MDEKSLKNIIKKLVKESLTEIFAEMKLEALVESAVSRNISKQKPATPAPFGHSTPLAPNLAAEKKKKMMENLRVKDDVWANIYADTASSTNPILEDNAAESDDGISLEKIGGLMKKDYSKHIGIKEPTSEDAEWQKRREARAKMLNEALKRS